MPRSFLLFFLGILVLIALIGYAAYRAWKQEQKRRALLMQWAVSSGWTYVVEDNRYCGYWNDPPFGLGDHRRANNVITGTLHDRQFAGFDYTYETHSNDGQGRTSTTTHHYRIAAIRLPAMLPHLQVTPENLFTRIGNAIGLDDIELESEDFNRKFRVNAEDRKFASDVLAPRTMELLLSRPGLSWRVRGADIIGWQDGKIAPAALLAMLDTLEKIVGGIPSFVWHDHGAEPRGGLS